MWQLVLDICNGKIPLPEIDYVKLIEHNMKGQMTNKKTDKVETKVPEAAKGICGETLGYSSAAEYKEPEFSDYKFDAQKQAKIDRLSREVEFIRQEDSNIVLRKQENAEQIARLQRDNCQYDTRTANLRERYNNAYKERESLEQRFNVSKSF